MKRALSPLAPTLRLKLLPLLTGCALFLATLGVAGLLMGQALSAAWKAHTDTALLIAVPQPETSTASSAQAQELLKKLASLPDGKNATLLPENEIKTLFTTWGAPWEGPLPLVFRLPPNAVSPSNVSSPQTPSQAHSAPLSAPPSLPEQIHTVLPHALVITPPPQATALPETLAPLFRHADLASTATVALALLMGCGAACLGGRLACLQTLSARRLLEDFGVRSANKLSFSVSWRCMAGAIFGSALALGCAFSQFQALSPFLHGSVDIHRQALTALSGLGGMVVFLGLVGWCATQFFLKREQQG